MKRGYDILLLLFGVYPMISGDQKWVWLILARLEGVWLPPSSCKCCLLTVHVHLVGVVCSN